VLRSGDALGRFCEDLASDRPAPGGGTASAAAGAMAASLLSMVCCITLKSKKYEESWPEIGELRARAERLQKLLIRLAAEDAEAYDELSAAMRDARKSPGDDAARSRRADALEHAIDVPLRTAEACLEVLRMSSEVATKGVKSAASDVEVAELLARAGIDGALANVAINLPECDDGELASETKRKVDAIVEGRRRVQTSSADRL